MRFNAFPFPTHHDVFGNDQHATLVAWIPVAVTIDGNGKSSYSSTYFRAIVETLPGRFKVLSVERNWGFYEVDNSSPDQTYHEAIKAASDPKVGDDEFPSLSRM